MLLIILNGKFAAGEIVFTRGAQSRLSTFEAIGGLVRHLTGDWGDLGESDRKGNEAALEHGFRLSSRYVTPGGKTFWIITEHDRSVTTILLPEEY